MLISKRAGVKSDKPAYEKKEKGESGKDIYRYDESHIKKRWNLKKDKIKKLEKNISKIKQEYEKDLSSDDLKTRAIACVVGIIDYSSMRIGNPESAREAKTYGATTLKVKHVTFSGGKASFKFPGKGNIEQDTMVENAKVVKVLKELVKGKKADDFIFEIDGNKIWDRTVNRYLSKFNISAKDLRGFHANRLMKETLKKKDFNDALKEVAEIVGHEQATLKNQYLDPELVEKYEGKDKKKKASLSIRAEESVLDEPMYTDPSQSQQLISADVNKNVNNIDSKINVSEYPDLLVAWRIIAPFLPDGATWSSGARDDHKQAQTILEYWSSKWWDRPDARDAGFFQTNYEKGELNVPFKIHKSLLRRIHTKAKNRHSLSEANLWWIEQIRKIMVSYVGGLKGGPIKALNLAQVGTSSHRFGTALDIANANLNDIQKAISYVINTFPESIQIVNIINEPGNRAVHVELGRRVAMPNIEKFTAALQHYQTGAKLVKQQGNKLNTMKCAKLMPEDAAWVQNVLKFRPTTPMSGGLQVPIDAKRSMRIKPGVKLNRLILDAWRTLQPFLPRSAIMTSGFRTAEDQKRILDNYWKKATGKRIPEHLKSDERVWPQVSVLLKTKYNYIVGPPITKRRFAHLNGNAFDISGAGLDDIASAVRMVSNNKRLPVKFRKPLIEEANNAVHVGIESAVYDELSINEVLRSSGRTVASISSLAKKEDNEHTQVEELYSDLLASGPPNDVLKEFEMIFNVASLDEDLASNKNDFRTDMGFGKEDEIGDWFEKSPIFRWRDDITEFDIHDVAESEAKNLAENDPEKFFYRGLHKEYPNLEPIALSEMIKNNAKFFFIFLYHERDEDSFKNMIEEAAEALSLQDARAFFYYHLHHKFPELGRGAIIQLIDNNPDSFFDLGLQKDYPDLEESAGAARNIKDPNKVELEYPEWIKKTPDSGISIRDRNASKKISIRAMSVTEPIDPYYSPVHIVDDDPLMQKHKEVPEGHYRDAKEFYPLPPSNDEASKINPVTFLISKQLREAFPDLLPYHATMLIEENPLTYFLMHLDDLPELKHLNQGALLGLIAYRPEKYFHMGMFLKTDYSHAVDSAAINMISEDPEYFLSVARSSPVLEEILRNFIPDAEQKIKERTAGLKTMISKRATNAPKIDLTEEEQKVIDVFSNTVKQFKLGTTVRIAGGWVRDKVMGRESKDIDVAVDNMMGKQFADYVERYARSSSIDISVGVIPAKPEQGKNLETAVIHMFGQEIEVVNLRDEEYDEISRHPVTTITDSPIKDAFRRDLTINSLFYNTGTGEVEDFTGDGINDIRNGIIRTPTTSAENEEKVGRKITSKAIFMDDPLRVLRAIRFANRYGFKIEDDLERAAKDPEVQDVFRKKITWERRQDELRKIMSERKSPRYALELIKDWGYRSEILQLPDEYSEWELDQNNPYHELNVWNHLMEALDNIYTITKDMDLNMADRYILNWATFLHDIGKLDPRIRGTKQVGDQIVNTFHGHEDESIKAAEHLLRQLKGTRNEEIKRIQTLIDAARRMNPQHTDPTEQSDISRKSLGKILQITKDFENDWQHAMEVAIADSAAHKEGWMPTYPTEYWESLRGKFEEMPRGTGTMGPILNGNELMQLFGRKGGHWLGQLNKVLIEWQMENPDATKEQATEFAKQYYAEQGLDKSASLSPRHKTAADILHLSGIPPDVLNNLHKLPGADAPGDASSTVAGQINIGTDASMMWNYFDRTKVHLGKRGKGYSAQATVRFFDAGSEFMPQYLTVFNFDNQNPHKTLGKLQEFLLNPSMPNKMLDIIEKREAEENEGLADVIPLFNEDRAKTIISGIENRLNALPGEMTLSKPGEEYGGGWSIDHFPNTKVYWEVGLSETGESIISAMVELTQGDSHVADLLKKTEFNSFEEAVSNIESALSTVLPEQLRQMTERTPTGPSREALFHSSYKAISKIAATLSPEDLKKMYELEYRLAMLSRRPVLSHRMEKLKFNLEHDLHELLKNGFNAALQAADAWLNHPAYGVMAKQVVDGEFSMGDEGTESIEKAYYSIVRLKNDLEKGPTGDISGDLVTFQKVLTTAHQDGSLGMFLPFSGPDLEKLLDELSAGKYIPEYSVPPISASVSMAISKRAKDRPKAGVFIKLPSEMAKQFQSLGEHDDSVPHITTLFIGHVPEKQEILLEEIVKRVAMEHDPFDLSFDEKVSYFPATEHSDGCKVAKLSIVSPELRKLHKALKKAITGAEMSVDDHFPNYKPHVTLEYMKPPKEKYTYDIPHGSWTAEQIEIWNGNKKIPINLGRKKKAYLSKRSI